MPELYPGQTDVVRDKLAQAELIHESRKEELNAQSDPARRANLLRLLAGDTGTIASYKRQLKKCLEGTPSEVSDAVAAQEERRDVVRVRLSAAERARLEAAASEIGINLSEYIRLKCEL